MKPMADVLPLPLVDRIFSLVTGYPIRMLDQTLSESVSLADCTFQRNAYTSEQTELQ
jgi:hypothetical protein